MLDVTPAEERRGVDGSPGPRTGALARISTAVAEDRPPEELFAVIAEATASAIGCDVGAVVEFVDDAPRAARGCGGSRVSRPGDRLPAPIRRIFRYVRRTGRAARLSPPR